MKKILITGGTTFVSRYAAEYFVKQNYEVYVLNRNSRPQVKGAKLIEGDRHHLGAVLKSMHFDVVADITAYDAADIIDLYNALGSFDQYIMISSSAVYPEYGTQPFSEDSEKAENKFWGAYGTNKIAAENALLERVPDAYILRPPYLYGPMNNVYREAFVFDCAKADRKFYLPKDGGMKLQFFFALYCIQDSISQPQGEQFFLVKMKIFCQLFDLASFSSPVTTFYFTEHGCINF